MFWVRFKTAVVGVKGYFELELTCGRVGGMFMVIPSSLDLEDSHIVQCTQGMTQCFQNNRKRVFLIKNPSDNC